jgi:hypothetical protein
MSASNTTLRLITVLFILAGILLLRKPVFGQAITTAPTRFSVVIQGAAVSNGADVILIPSTSGSQDGASAEAKLLTPNYPLHLIWIVVFAGAPAAFDKAAQFFIKPSARAN